MRVCHVHAFVDYGIEERRDLLHGHCAIRIIKYSRRNFLCCVNAYHGMKFQGTVLILVPRDNTGEWYHYLHTSTRALRKFQCK